LTNSIYPSKHFYFAYSAYLIAFTRLAFLFCPFHLPQLLLLPRITVNKNLFCLISDKHSQVLRIHTHTHTHIDAHTDIHTSHTRHTPPTHTDTDTHTHTHTQAFIADIRTYCRRRRTQIKVK
ncbi:hypothetical protein WUBG_15925, partial [Wuchereria bancrofti]